ncbi:MAG: MBL fold metallo-hydrolase [Deltaproteobacteria bacterium]|nr:MBL fold metallo-hydrolase [Deltaproteobacteria bacterium]
MGFNINEVDKIEILTLQDNYIDLLARDNNEVVQRAMPLKGLEIKNSLLAEHGFSSVVTVTRGGESSSILFDFGFSAQGAAFNAKALDVDLSQIETCVVSHGHLDHVGGLAELMKGIGKQKVDLVIHPEAFRKPRYLKITDEFKVFFPSFEKEMVEAAGLNVVETEVPYPLLDGDLLFLGEVPRQTDFENGMPSAYYEKDGKETWDDIIDDSSVVAHVKGKGLVILSGCGHSGIINTVRYAGEVTGVKEVYAVMGGFHLSGDEMQPAVAPTIQGLKEMDPTFVIPTHCTGRDAILEIEREMPDRFILNMVGTRLTFAG